MAGWYISDGRGGRLPEGRYSGRFVLSAFEMLFVPAQPSGMHVFLIFVTLSFSVCP